MRCTLMKCSVYTSAVYICKTFLDILMMPSHYSIIIKCLLPLVRYKEPTSTFLNIMTTDLKLYLKKNSGIWFIYTLETQKQHACKKEKRKIVKTLKTSCAHRKWQNTQKQNINSYSITSASFKRLGVRTCEKMRKNCLIS